MGKYVLLLSKTNENMHHIYTTNEYNSFNEEQKASYIKIDVENDPPVYDIFSEMSVIGDIKDLLQNVNEENQTTKANWKIVKVPQHVKQERLMRHNELTITNYKEAHEKHLTQLKMQYQYQFRGKTYLINMDMDNLYKEFLDKNILYPMILPVYELVALEDPDIIETLEDKSPKYIKVPGWISLDGFDIQKLMFAYRKDIKMSYADFGKRIKQDVLSTYEDLVEFHKLNRDQ